MGLPEAGGWLGGVLPTCSWRSTMNGLCWEAGCSIRGLPPAGAEARRSSTRRCDGRGGGCWEGKRSSWAGRRPSRPGLHHREEARVGLRGDTHSQSMERSQGHYPRGKEESSGPVPRHPWPRAPAQADSPSTRSSRDCRTGRFLPTFPGAGPGCCWVLQTIAADPQGWRVAT